MKTITVVALVLILPLCSNPALSQGIDSSRVVKVLSFNILHGSTTRNDFDLDALANVIKQTNPDFVAMQEVDFKVNRSRGYDLVTELGWRTRMSPIFGKAMAYDGGEYGEGILSRYSFIATRNIPLPFMRGEEPRAAVEVLTELPSGDTIAFVGTHFAHEGEEGRTMQAQKLNEVLAAGSYPTILAGDLNAEPGSETISLLEEVWQSTYNRKSPEFTFPSDQPRKKIDYVMFRPAGRWKLLDKRVICDTIASDHCVYLVTLELQRK